MRVYVIRLVLMLVTVFSTASAETAEEVLQLGAKAVSGVREFSARGWGCVHSGRANSSSGLLAYEVLYRAPGNLVIVSLHDRLINGRSYSGGLGQSFVYQLGDGTARRGGWAPRGAGPSEESPVDMPVEISRRMGTDPYAQIVHYWHSRPAMPFEWRLRNATLLPQDGLGGPSTWRVAGRDERNQEVHLWFDRASHTLVRSVVIERGSGQIRSISEWYYDQVANPGNLGEVDFSAPRQLPYQPPLTLESMSLTDYTTLAADFATPAVPEIESGTGAIASASRPAKPTGPISQKLTAEQMAAIVLIENGDGQASGFLTKIRDVPFVVTNLHVLGDDPQLTVRNLNGEVIPTQGIFGAVGRDIAIIRVGAVTGDLSPLDDILGGVQIGDEVVVVGNRRGGRVATQVEGKVLGIGPGRIEVDAPFEPGNSGSPVVHLKSGKVIGVATYSETRQTEDEATGMKGEVEQRWFAYRLDGIAQWESIDPQQWRTQYRQIQEFFEDTEALYYLSRANLRAGKENPRIRPYVESFEERFNRFGSSSNGVVGEMQNFLSNLRGRGQTGVRELKSGQFYDYFRSSLYWKTNIKEQLDFREWTSQRIDMMTRNVDGWRAQVRNGQGR